MTMNKKHIISSFNGRLPEEYQEPFAELYEAIYKKDKPTIKERLLAMLKTTLARYPEKPTEKGSQSEGAYNAMELLSVDLDIDYGYWLRDVKGVIANPPLWEDNSVLMENVDNPSQIEDIIVSIKFYVDPSPSPYTQQELLQAIDELQTKGETEVFPKDVAAIKKTLEEYSRKRDIRK